MQHVKIRMSMVVAELAQIHDEMSFLIKKRDAGIREMAQHCSIRTGVLILVPESGASQIAGLQVQGIHHPLLASLGTCTHMSIHTHN